jgi:LCP family protein required for cell wall assembly
LWALLVFFVAFVSASFWWLSVPFRASAQSPVPTHAVGIHKVQDAAGRPDLGEPLFIAVMGSDARSGPPDAGGGCDAIHIVAINPQQKAGTVLNFPRDSYLNGTKLTDVCRRSGFESGINVLKAHTGIPIQYYVKTEFSHFMAFINEVGGIDINVPYAMNDVPSGAFFQPGPIRMSGGGLLSFVRNRKDTPRGDFSRTENQGAVIIASLTKYRGELATDPHRLFDILKAAQRHIKVTIPLGDLIKLALLANEIDPVAMQNVNVPGSSGSAGSASVVYLSPGDTYDRVRDDAIY